MKQVMVTRFECEACGSHFDKDTEIKSCKYCGGDSCPNCAKERNFRENTCEGCYDKKLALEEFVNEELNWSTVVFQMLSDIKAENGIDY